MDPLFLSYIYIIYMAFLKISKMLECKFQPSWENLISRGILFYIGTIYSVIVFVWRP